MNRLFALICSACVLFPAAARTSAPETEVRNVVLMIGDGMGATAVGALMLENGYAPVAFDRAQTVALCKTYSANNRITDSSAAATAMATGHKTVNNHVGMTPDDRAVPTLTELAEASGRSTGIVVTSHLADATPAAFVAHTTDRYDDRTITQAYVSAGIDVLAGGGRRFFEQTDGEGSALEMLQAKGYRYTATTEEFLACGTTPLIGLFSDKYMPPATERGDYLARATKHTLELLSRNPQGFFVLIEGSQIDGGGHQNNAELLLSELRDFDKAVAAAFDFADSHPGTLVVVTADHETGGLSIVSNDGDFTASESGVAYRYSTGSHTAAPVLLFAYGTGAERFAGVLENTDIFRLIASLLFK